MHTVCITLIWHSIGLIYCIGWRGIHHTVTWNTVYYTNVYTSHSYTIYHPPSQLYFNDTCNTRFILYIYIYNIRTLSVNIKFICTSFRNRQNSEPLASFSGLFRSEYKYILYLTTMYVYCVYPAVSKKSENLSDLNKRTEASVIPRLS